MKAWIFEETGQPLKRVERDDPEPADGEVVVELRAAGLNRRDYWITQGMYPGLRSGVVVGSDGAGEVVATGDGVDSTLTGKAVLVDPGMEWGDDAAAQSDDYHILGMPRDGVLAERVAVPADRVHEKPDFLNWAETAALPVAGVTAYRAAFSRGGLKKDERVLITGIGGGVATMALLFAVAAGAEVWVTS